MRDQEQDLPPLVQIIPEAGIKLPPAPSGQPPKRKIEGSIALPTPLAEEVQRCAEEQDKDLFVAQDRDPLNAEEKTHTLEDGTPFHPLGGGTFCIF